MSGCTALKRSGLRLGYWSFPQSLDASRGTFGSGKLGAMAPIRTFALSRVTRTIGLSMSCGCLAFIFGSC